MTKNNQTLVNEQQIPEGYKKTEVGLIPDDWETPKFGEICTLINGRGFKPYEWSKKGLPIIRIQNLNGSDEFNYYEGTYDSKIFIENGQLLFAWSGSRGTSFGPHIWKGQNALLNYHTWKLNINHSKVNDKYFYHILKSLTKVIEDSAHGASALVHTQKGEMEKFDIPLPPSRVEQEKIATALSDTDALISELEKLIEKKQAIKTATMQQLLTGKTRLPEFALREDGTPKAYKESELGQIPEDWEVCKFEKLCKVFTKQTGFDYSAYIKPSLIKQYKRGHIPFVQNKDFEGKNFNFDTDYYIPKDIAEKFPNILLNEKCLLISISGSIGNVGLFNESSLAFIGGAIAIAKFIDPNKLDWVMYYMLSQQGQNTLLNNVKAGSHQNITLEDIRKFSIPLPSDMEQNLITSMLSSLDAEIKNLDFRLDKLKRIKLGMMQELLTGKTRLV